MQQTERAPTISLKLTAARELVTTLSRDVGQFVLDAAAGVTGAAKKLADLRTTIAAAQRDVGELEAALPLAHKIDESKKVEERYHSRLEELAQFEEAAKQKQRAVAVYCRAAEVAAKAYLDILDISLQMEGWLPAGTDLRPFGLSPQSAEALILDGNGNAVSSPTSTETIAASELQRHARITRVGTSGAMPGARAISPTVMQNPDAVESWVSSNERLSLTMVGILQDQIEKLRQRELDAIETRFQEVA